jgi:hypothetical protein
MSSARTSCQRVGQRLRRGDEGVDRHHAGVHGRQDIWEVSVARDDGVRGGDAGPRGSSGRRGGPRRWRSPRSARGSWRQRPRPRGPARGHRRGAGYGRHRGPGRRRRSGAISRARKRPRDPSRRYGSRSGGRGNRPLSAAPPPRRARIRRRPRRGGRTLRARGPRRNRAAACAPLRTRSQRARARASPSCASSFCCDWLKPRFTCPPFRPEAPKPTRWASSTTTEPARARQCQRRP